MPINIWWAIVIIALVVCGALIVTAAIAAVRGDRRADAQDHVEKDRDPGATE